MEWLIGLLVGALGVAAGLWASYRRGGAEQRERTLAALAAAAERERKRKADADAAIERERITAVERIRDVVAEHKAEAAKDIDAAEAALRKRTEEPWEP